jgi:transcription termination factor NusB
LQNKRQPLRHIIREKMEKIKINELFAKIELDNEPIIKEAWKSKGVFSFEVYNKYFLQEGEEVFENQEEFDDMISCSSIPNILQHIQRVDDLDRKIKECNTPFYKKLFRRFSRSANGCG